jgi:hypothetical protein
VAITIQRALKQLLQVVGELQSTYPKKKFTLDGRLVGDLGEALVEDAYDVELFDRVVKHYDARTPDGRRVQIKAPMKESLTFRVRHCPDYYVGIQIRPDGSFAEIFNGPGFIAAKAVENRKPIKANLHSVSIGVLKRLNETVQETDRIPKRFT